MQIEKTNLPNFTVQGYRFKFSDSEMWKQYLQEYGFVVIQNYLPKQTCEKYVEQFWDIMEYLSDGPLDRNNPKTQILGKNYPPVLHGGMIQYIGHSKPQWQLRRLSKPLFQVLWNQNDLKTSFDGFCFMNGRRNYQERQDNAFLHVDQSPTKDFIWSYQGVMTLTDADQNGGGFVCVPKSHLYHHDYFSKKKLLNLKQNWFVVPENDKGDKVLSQIKKVNTQAGDFILFDSRTFHCNTVPTSQTLRVCTYICMLPTNKIPQQICQKRKQAVKDRRTSNHHPGDGFKIFPALPRYLQDRNKFEKMLTKINSYCLNEKQKQLI